MKSYIPSAAIAIVLFCRLHNFLVIHQCMNKIAYRCDCSSSTNMYLLSVCPLQVPYVKVAPEDILKVQVPRFTTLDLRPTNTDISLAVAGLLTFFNSTTSCLICAQADCKCCIRALRDSRPLKFSHAHRLFPSPANKVRTPLSNLPESPDTSEHTYAGGVRPDAATDFLKTDAVAMSSASTTFRSGAARTPQLNPTRWHPRSNCRVHSHYGVH